MTKRKTTEEAEANAEMIYRATGRIKGYPEKEFTKNNPNIKVRSEKKRDRNNIRLVSDLVQRIYEFLEQVIMYYLVSFFLSVCV